MISVIIPCLNEEDHIVPLIQQIRCADFDCQIIVVDGGSTDKTVEKARPLVDIFIQTEKGRAKQLNAGAEKATGSLLWFVHADSQVSLDVLNELKPLIKRKDIWGRFNVQFSGQHWAFKMIAFMMNHRSCLTGIATGDQGIFISRSLFLKVNGFPNIALMEDIEISKYLKKISRPICLKACLITSHRRWQDNGIFRTMIKMWWFRLRWFFGCSAQSLANKYHF